MQNVLEYIEQNRNEFEEQLFDLLRIPSISTDKSHKEDIQKAAQYLADHLKSAGISRAEVMETSGNPVVYAEHCEAGDDKPTVLIYGHYDVQPSDPDELWETPPFEPTVRDGKVYARGASDDKGQVFMHVSSVISWLKSGEKLPVNVKLLIEGEEEIGSPSLIPFVKENKELLKCDMVLVSDTTMYDEEQPSITYGLRGMSYMEVNVEGPNRDLHSGAYGGAVQNPVNALCEMLARLKDEDGVIQIPGFYDKVVDLTEEEREKFRQLPFDEEQYKAELEVDELFGEKGYSTLERASARPTLDVNGIWGGYQGEGSKTVLPAKAGAKVSMRLVPEQDQDEIADLFKKHILKIAPPGVRVDVVKHHGGTPVKVPLDFEGLQAAADSLEEVYNVKPLFTMEGGSIPIVADFEKILGVNTILMGMGLRSDAIHSPNEKFTLRDFHRGIEASARFFKKLAEL